MRTFFPDYDNCLVNLTCSVQKYFGIEPKHKTLPVVDEELARGNYRNVVFLLFDGMGANLLERILGPESYFARHKVCDICSVLPTTTTAATTAVLSGLTPYEHGWLGWDVYFKAVDKIVTIFPNFEKGKWGVPAADYHVAQRCAPYTSIMKQVSDSGNGRGIDIQPFGTGMLYREPDELFAFTERVCAEEGRHFIYAYSDSPDHIFHAEGVGSPNAKAYLEHVSRMTEEMCSRLGDTLVIVFADHGHLDVKPVYVSDHPDLAALLERGTSVEPRCCSFKVKAGRGPEFEQLFTRYFGEDFLLLTADEVRARGIFGGGQKAATFDDALGDYLAVAVTDKFINNDRTCVVHASTHAGITEDEMLVPLIFLPCK